MTDHNIGAGQVRLDCANPDWKRILEQSLRDGVEVDLQGFDYTADGQACEKLAASFLMTLQLDARRRVASFKKKGS